MAEHVFDPSIYHHVWDREIPTAMTVEPGDVVHFDVLMAGERQIENGYTFADCNFDFDTLYNLSGPIDVAGAEVGDTIEIEILSLETGPYGWCAFLPGVGLLPEDFTEGYVHHFDLTRGSTTTLRPGVEIPIVPFCGTMGTCPDRPGRFVPFPPHEGGGNMDTRHLIAGTTLYLPVHIAGGRFSFGDPHAAQGDGEVCVAAIECGMKASLRFGLHKKSIPGPWFVTQPGSLTPRSDVGGYYGTTGIADDLMTGAKTAVRSMIQLLGEMHGLTPTEAYMLCSLAGDLKIYEIVDMGMWNVGMCMPRSVFVG
jgi:acetamidase/formamidase